MSKTKAKAKPTIEHTPEGFRQALKGLTPEQHERLVRWAQYAPALVVAVERWNPLMVWNDCTKIYDAWPKEHRPAYGHNWEHRRETCEGYRRLGAWLKRRDLLVEITDGARTETYQIAVQLPTALVEYLTGEQASGDLLDAQAKARDRAERHATFLERTKPLREKYHTLDREHAQTQREWKQAFSDVTVTQLSQVSVLQKLLDQRDKARAAAAALAKRAGDIYLEVWERKAPPSIFEEYLLHEGGT